MKIAILDEATLGTGLDLSIFDKFGDVVRYPTTSVEELMPQLDGIDIVITNKVEFGEKEFESAPQLKLICLTATGMDNIDLEAAANYGVVVKNVKGYSTNSVAQHTFSMLFHLMESNHYYDNYTRDGGWANSHTFTNIDKTFWEVKGKKWGIIGLGDIGREVAKIAQVFGANVSYFSPSGNKYDDELKYYDDLNAFLKDNKIVTIHTPLNNFSKDLIKKAQLELLQPGAIILNLARGGIINEKDVAWAVDNLDIYHGVDALETEPMTPNHPFLSVKRKDRLFVTPHIAWASIEARTELIERVAENIETFLNQ